MFIFLGGAPTSICHFCCPSIRSSIRLSIHPSLCHALYFRNCTSCDHYFWYTCVKSWYLQIFWVVRRGKRAKIAQNKKSELHPSCIVSQEQFSMWSWFLVHLCKRWYPQVFFHFLKVLISQVFRGGGGGKRAKNGPKFSPSCSIAQEPYIIWLSFMVHMCKMIISPGIVLIFPKFSFSELLGG